jgi:hypothetical protein
MISFESNRREILELSKALEGSGPKIRRQLAVAVNKTATKTLAQLAKEDARELAVTQKVIKATMKVETKATANSSPTSIVVQRKTGRISLRDFNAHQTKTGVSHKISKKGGRNTVVGAFQGPKPGVINVKTKGHVFKRVGKDRLPIRKLFGPSPWGVTVKNNLTQPVVRFSREQLKKEIKERTRFLNLKKSGAI